MVPRRGIEPRTQGFSVPCSTDWAIWAYMAGATGLEPATSGVTGQRSNQLSYTPTGCLEYINQIFLKWWSLLGSNQWPPACKAGALPTELSDRKVLSLVRPRGIEPLLPGWKPEVLTTRRRAHSLRCLLSSFFISSQDE